MEVEGHHQVIDVGMEVVMVEAVAVAAVVLVGAVLVSHAILNFELLFVDSHLLRPGKI
jgi:hypothetical protein